MWLILACAPPPAQSASPCEGLPPADGFTLPVGGGEGTGYYDAQPFGRNGHLGSDWNGVGGGNTDFGAPVSAIASGRVTFAEDLGGGWGQVVRVVHRDGDRCVESLYAHLSAVEVEVGQEVARGQRIGAIGDAGGIYLAHLHFELRTVAGRELGGGYGRPDAQVDPTAFVASRRPPG